MSILEPWISKKSKMITKIPMPMMDASSCAKNLIQKELSKLKRLEKKKA